MKNERTVNMIARKNWQNTKYGGEKGKNRIRKRSKTESKKIIQRHSRIDQIF